LTTKRTRMARPLRSTGITRLHRYYGTSRPCAPHRYSAPHGVRRLGVSLSRPATSGPPVHRGDTFPRSARKPGPRSRRLHAGHHLGSKQVSPRLIPGPHLRPGFDAVLILSTRHQRFAFARLRDPHLTRSRRAFSATLSTPALDRRTWRWFAASPCRTAAEGRSLHLPCSIAARSSPSTSSGSSFAFVAHRYRNVALTSVADSRVGPPRYCDEARSAVR
jgi:hypothetical protein